MQGRSLDLQSINPISQDKWLQAEKYRSCLFEEVYVAAQTGKENHLASLCNYMHVRLGIDTPLSLLAEKGDHTAVQLLINKFGGNVFEAIIGYARGRHIPQLKELVTANLHVANALALEGFATRQHLDLANCIMESYADQPQKLPSLQRALFVGGLLGGKEDQAILDASNVSIAELATNLYQLAIAGRFALIEKILAQQAAEINRGNALKDLHLSILEGATLGGHFSSVENYLRHYPNDKKMTERFILAVTKSGHALERNLLPYHSPNEIDLVKVHAEQGHFSNVTHMLQTAAKKSKNKMLNAVVETFKNSAHFSTDALIRRSLVFLGDATLGHELATQLKLPPTIISDVKKIIAIREKYNLDYRLALIWLNLSNPERELFLQWPRMAISLFAQLPSLPSELVMMIAAYSMPDITPHDIVQLYHKTTLYFYKKLFLNDVKNYSNDKMKRLVTSCLQTESITEFAALLNTEIEARFNVAKKTSHFSLLVNHSNRLQHLFALKNPEQDLFNTLCQHAENGDLPSLLHLVASGLCVNTYHQTMTPIMLLARQNKRAAVMLLLRVGARINDAALGAAMGAHLTLIQECLNWGADAAYVAEGLAMINHASFSAFFQLEQKSLFFAIRGAAKGGHDTFVDRLVNSTALSPQEQENCQVYAAQGYALAGRMNKVRYIPENLPHDIITISLQCLAIREDFTQIKKAQPLTHLISKQHFWNSVAEGLGISGNLYALDRMIRDVAQNNLDLNRLLVHGISACIRGGYHQYAKSLIQHYWSDQTIDTDLICTAIQTHIEMKNLEQALQYIPPSHSRKYITHTLLSCAKQHYFGDDKSSLRFTLLLALIADVSLRKKFMEIAKQLQNSQSTLLKHESTLSLHASFQTLAMGKSLLQKADQLHMLKKKHQLNIKQLFALLLLGEDQWQRYLKSRVIRNVAPEVRSTINLSLFKDYNPTIVAFLATPLIHSEIDDLCEKMIQHQQAVATSKCIGSFFHTAKKPALDGNHLLADEKNSCLQQ